jgi:hypothetical protein
MLKDKSSIKKKGKKDSIERKKKKDGDFFYIKKEYGFPPFLFIFRISQKEFECTL